MTIVSLRLAVSVPGTLCAETLIQYVPDWEVLGVPEYPVPSQLRKGALVLWAVMTASVSFRSGTNEYAWVSRPSAGAFSNAGAQVTGPSP
ncbi:MAG: hypothetical protein A4E30_01573 [Methanomassiliicoccales archaeon PtaB.Bin215]|nr:MAG: hypothetical protein A4E30_01573 [Methanomassiliicoccales archaeon PtaB.Bin215]